MTEKKPATRPKRSNAKPKANAADDVSTSTEAEPTPPPVKKTAERSFSNGFLILIMFAVCAQLAYAFYINFVADHSSIAQDLSHVAAAFDTIDKRLGNIEDDIETLYDIVNDIENAGYDSSIVDDISALEERVSDLEITAETFGEKSISTDQIDNFIAAKKQLETLQKSVALEQKGQLHSVTQLTALDQISQGVQTGQPYAASLNALKQTLDADSNLVSLVGLFDSYQDGGAPDMQSLQQHFSEAVDVYYQDKKGADDSIAGRIMHNLSGLVSVRKVGESHSGDDPEARIARAEAALQKQKLHVAINEIRALPEDDAPYFYEWKKSASDYLSLRTTITKLRSQLSADMKEPQKVPTETRITPDAVVVPVAPPDSPPFSVPAPAAQDETVE